MFFNRKFERGQVLLVVILASVIALTVGLAAVSRTITNTKVTTEEEDSQKALSAAEAGIEELAGNPSLLSSGAIRQLSNNSKFDAKATALAVGNPFAVNGGQLISKDDGADIWLSNYPDYSGQWSGNLGVYWERSSSACSSSIDEAALEIVILSGTSTNTPNLTRYAVDRCASSRSNNFTSSGILTDTIGGVTYNAVAFTVTSGYIARVIPIYRDTKIQVEYSTATFPNQGSIITSTGASGDARRTVQVIKGYPRVPVEFFPYNLFLPQ